jgi:hypothetical protein
MTFSFVWLSVRMGIQHVLAEYKQDSQEQGFNDGAKTNGTRHWAEHVASSQEMWFHDQAGYWVDPHGYIHNRKFLLY